MSRRLIDVGANAKGAHETGAAVMDETRIHTKNPKWIGRELNRFEDRRLLTGAGQFVDDIAPPHCYCLQFIRSKYARGRVRGLNSTDAAAMPGIAAIFTGGDLVELGALQVNAILPVQSVHCPIMATNDVNAVGQLLAAVIGDDPQTVRSAAEQVHVDIEPLQTEPPTEVFRWRWVNGDAAAAFAQARHIVKVQFDHARVAPAAVEPRATLANYDRQSGELTAWLSTQTPHRSRHDLARILGLSAEKIRVIAPDIGGTFGGKASIYPEDVVVAWAAWRLGRPVKWCATRNEDFLSATHGRGSRSEGEMALSEDGRILALRARLSFPLGHWLPYSATVPAWNASRILPGPYKIAAVDIETTGAMHHTAPVGIYRGAGRPEAAMLMERLVEQAARAIGVEPNALRRRNLVQAHEFPYRTPTGETLDSGNYEKLLDRTCSRARYSTLLKERDLRRAKGQICGVGTALYVEPCGRGWESASIKINREGRIIAATGSTNQGQGRETTFAQIVADALVLNPHDVTIHHGDTALTPTGIGALASRSTAIGGSALLEATKTFREKACALAAQLLQVPTDEIELDAGGFRRRRGELGFVNWASIAAAAFAEKSGSNRNFALETSIVYHAKGEVWSSGCCIVPVTIDHETGVLHVERIFCVDDAGVVINPRLTEGQLLGGLVQGLGEAVLERLVYDESGELLTGSFTDYSVPHAANIPEIVLDNLVTSSPLNTLGAKGVGEAGCIGAPAAIVNAVLDALSPLGIRTINTPLTSEKIWKAIKDAGAMRPHTLPEQDPATEGTKNVNWQNKTEMR